MIAGSLFSTVAKSVVVLALFACSASVGAQTLPNDQEFRQRLIACLSAKLSALVLDKSQDFRGNNNRADCETPRGPSCSSGDDAITEYTVPDPAAYDIDPATVQFHEESESGADALRGPTVRADRKYASAVMSCSIESACGAAGRWHEGYIYGRIVYLPNANDNRHALADCLAQMELRQ